MRWIVLALCLLGCGIPPESGSECGDDADNDRDGAFDCDDPDCAESVLCQGPADTGDTGSR